MSKVNNSFSGSDGTDKTLTNPATYVYVRNLDDTNSMSITIGGIEITIPASTEFANFFERFTTIVVTNGDSCEYIGYTTGPILPS